MLSVPPSATPAPIPAFAPVERPLGAVQSKTSHSDVRCTPVGEGVPLAIVAEADVDVRKVAALLTDRMVDAEAAEVAVRDDAEPVIGAEPLETSAGVAVQPAVVGKFVIPTGEHMS